MLENQLRQTMFDTQCPAKNYGEVASDDHHYLQLLKRWNLTSINQPSWNKMNRDNKLYSYGFTTVYFDISYCYLLIFKMQILLLTVFCV